MINIKKGFFIIISALVFIVKLHFYDSITVKAEEIEITIEVEDQKSEIEEQQVTPNIYAPIVNSMMAYEKDLICRITFLEAGNQNLEGQRAVIEVILNRIISEKYPNKVEDVLNASNQFSTWKNKNKVSRDQVYQMQNVLDLVCYSNDTILPNINYMYFNNNQLKKDSIKIQDQWFWE